MLYSFFLIIFGVFVGQEYYIPNIRTTFLYLSDKFLEYQQNRNNVAEPTNENNETDENIWQQFLAKIKENLNLNV